MSNINKYWDEMRVIHNGYHYDGAYTTDIYLEFIVHSIVHSNISLYILYYILGEYDRDIISPECSICFPYCYAFESHTLIVTEEYNELLRGEEFI